MRDQTNREIQVGDFIAAATMSYRSASLRIGIVYKVSDTSCTIATLSMSRGVIVSSRHVSHTGGNTLVLTYPPTPDPIVVNAYFDKRAELTNVR